TRHAIRRATMPTRRAWTTRRATPRRATATTAGSSASTAAGTAARSTRASEPRARSRRHEHLVERLVERRVRTAPRHDRRAGHRLGRRLELVAARVELGLKLPGVAVAHDLDVGGHDVAVAPGQLAQPRRRRGAVVAAGRERTGDVVVH